ncbi:hypothetical protein N0V86_007757 [Didymella sp. IMI 355093]|nr:hypothetical protein N0V86_007757 [Didymella sp. IMI 355093]
MKKPGAGMGVQPINTLNRGTGASSTNGRKQTTTYSKHDRKARSIGVQRHSGQEAWLERNSNHRVAISPTRDASHARPPKRRKTENPNAPRMDPVEIVDDEDEAAARSRQTLTPRPPSQFSSHSPYSTNSRHSDISSKRATQPVSEFMNTSGLMAPKRSKPRRKGANGHDVSCGGSPAEASFLGAGSQPHEQSIEIYQEDMDPRDSPRTSTLQSLKQGGDRVPVSRDLGQANGRVTSSYFKSKNPKMAINESIKTETAARDYDMRAEKLARSSGPGRNLRDFQPAEYASEVQDDLIEGSEDELSRPSAPESKDQKSPTEHAQVRKTAPKRLPTFGKSYVLSYARSYNIGPDCVNLTLGHTENPKEFRIGGQDSGGKVNVFEILDLGSVTKVQSDNLRSMRLTGGIIKGNKYWCDLTFAKTRDFKEFRSQYVDPEVLSQSVATQ